MTASPVAGTFSTAALHSIAAMEFLDRSRDSLRASGYVVHCLEAALWCFARSDSFETAVLLAANLGEDADTTAAVCGQLAGAHYGASSIPPGWLAKLVMRDEISRLADELVELGQSAD
jgi:ADP-ribosyl-[dinitrogen reductase] hydrolase